MKARLPKEFQSKSQTDLLKQAQKMQDDMQSLQEELDEREYSAAAGGDMVQVTINGKHEVKAIKISPDLIQEAQEDKEMLEDLIITAINTAVTQATETSETEMGKVSSGLNIPGLF